MLGDGGAQPDDVLTGFAPVDPLMTAVLPAAAPAVAAHVDPYGPPPSGPPLPPPVAPGEPPRGYLYAQVQPGWAMFTPAPPVRVAPRPTWSRRRKVVVTTASVLAGVVLVAGTAAAGTAFGRSVAEARLRQQAVTAHVLAEMPRLEQFVARSTGRPWTSTPSVKVLADADFLAALRRSDGGASPIQPRDDEDDVGVTVAAMGLAPDPDSYYDAGDAGTESSVTGFYDDSTKTLYVRGDRWSPVVETTVVHELVHANQDQSFELSALDAVTRTDDESWAALQAVVEGEATLVERDYAATKDEAWRRSVQVSDGSAPASDVPVVDTEGAFPYEMGADFVEAVRAAGGTTAVSRAFRNPPRWTRDLLDPKGWLDGTLAAVRIPARPISPTGSSKDIADVGVLGVEGLWLAVDAARPKKSDFAELSGWVGDSYVSTENSAADTWCFVDDVVFSSTTSGDRALRFLASWTDRKGIKVTRTSPTSARLSGCQKA